MGYENNRLLDKISSIQVTNPKKQETQPDLIGNILKNNASLRHSKTSQDTSGQYSVTFNVTLDNKYNINYLILTSSDKNYLVKLLLLILLELNYMMVV